MFSENVLLCFNTLCSPGMFSKQAGKGRSQFKAEFRPKNAKAGSTGKLEVSIVVRQVCKTFAYK